VSSTATRSAPAQLGEHGLQGALAGDELVLRDLEEDPREVGGQRGRGLGGDEGGRAEVDREVGVARAPGDGERRGDGAQLELDAQAAAVGEREPRVRRSPGRRVEARERLVARNAAGAQVDDRLEDGDHAVLSREQLLDLAALLGGSGEPGQAIGLQALLGREPFDELGLHGRVEQLEAVLALVLGEVHRDVGVAQQLLAGGGPRQAHRDADARRDRDVLAAQVERHLERLDEARGDLRRPLDARAVPRAARRTRRRRRRAAVSAERRHARSRLATPTSSSSPAAWP
jgi:hypothetical protein